jgi:hypothetical protein
MGRVLRAAVALAAAVLLAGCPCPAPRTAAAEAEAPGLLPLPEAPGVDARALRDTLRDLLAVGDARSAMLPDGFTVALFLPETLEDGLTLAAVRMDGAEPQFDTQTGCDALSLESEVASAFLGPGSARITSVAYGAWPGGEADVVVDFEATLEDYEGAYPQVSGTMSVRCIFRVVDDPDSGRVAAPILSLVTHAELRTSYPDAPGRDETEEDAVAAAAGDPGAIDVTVTTTTRSREGTGEITVPMTEVHSVTRRFRLVGTGVDTAFEDVYSFAYDYPEYDDVSNGEGYEEESGGYGEESGGYGEESGGYEEESGGYGEESGGYEQESGGYEEESGGQ